MVKNSRRKKKARHAAAANGTNYTTAMRALGQDTTRADLPQWAMFPKPGSADFAEVMNLASGGVLRLGLAADGEHLDWDLNAQPHGIFAGVPGCGKTTTLSTVVAYGLALPDEFEVIVCDPKQLELDWSAPHLPADRYAVTAVETHRAVHLAHQQMATTRSVFEATGSANLLELREKFRAAPALEETYGAAPKRILLVIDGLPQVLDAVFADPQWQDVVAATRTYLENISELGGESGVSLVCSAQRLDRNTLGPVLRGMDCLRVGIGRLDEYCSAMLFGSTARPPQITAGMHTGRAVAQDLHGYREAQLYYLPTLTDPELDPPFLREPRALDVASYRSDG